MTITRIDRFNRTATIPSFHGAAPAGIMAPWTINIPLALQNAESCAPSQLAYRPMSAQYRAAVTTRPDPSDGQTAASPNNKAPCTTPIVCASNAAIGALAKIGVKPESKPSRVIMAPWAANERSTVTTVKPDSLICPPEVNFVHDYAPGDQLSKTEIALIARSVQGRGLSYAWAYGTPIDMKI